MASLDAWVKALPAPVQTLFYAVETALIAGLIVFGSNLFAAFQNDTLATFQWHLQLHTFYIMVGAGVLKALLDLLKSLGKAST